VQQELEEALLRLTHERVSVVGSSRTDAGVHAMGLCAHFDSATRIPPEKIAFALNTMLPPDIRIRSIEDMPEGFNARFSAHAKSYVYVVNTGDINPFTNRYSWLLDDMTDIDALRKAIKYLEGEHDFSTFTVDRGSIDDPVRLILQTDVTTFGPLICMRFIGTGFLMDNTSVKPMSRPVAKEQFPL
jgi:tRNA pseudouridine38-40 synthase